MTVRCPLHPFPFTWPGAKGCEWRLEAGKGKETDSLSSILQKEHSLADKLILAQGS